MSFFSNHLQEISKLDTHIYKGKIKRIRENWVEAICPFAKIGDICYVLKDHKPIYLEIIGVSKDTVSLICFDKSLQITIDTTLYNTGEKATAFIGDFLKGCVIDYKGDILLDNNPSENERLNDDEIDSSKKSPENQSQTLPKKKSFTKTGKTITVNTSTKIDHFNKKQISEQFFTGIKAIDGLLPVGKGQRMGIFAGSGVGKSTLFSMLTKYSQAKTKVVVLVGERSREIKEFVENDLEQQGRKDSIVIATSSGESSLAKIKSVWLGIAIAEYFRDCGEEVLLMIDSITRFADAKRQISLLLGEPATTKGYTPSVFEELSSLVERTGTGIEGNITAFYSVLVEGDDFDEPLTDAMRGILDGHIFLDRKLANQGFYPPINVPSSISRLAPKVVKNQRYEVILKVKEWLALYEQNKDMINMGLYKQGSNPSLDMAIQKIEQINNFLKQKQNEQVTAEDINIFFEVILT